jgi:REG-2-like HAD superfamily hydrolase
MQIRAVTFDAAGTLIRSRWQPGAFAVECASQAGLKLDSQPAQEVYERLLQTRWTEYRRINETKDHGLCGAFWVELTRDWLAAINADANRLDKVMETADRLLYGPTNAIFGLFEDAKAAFLELKKRNLRLGIISNWDYSLHRVLKSLCIADQFDTVVVSLEEGVEKPERAIFQIALDRLGAKPEEAVHVGDDPVDDILGAGSAGIRALLIDRQAESPSPGRITSLTQIPEALGWNR